MTGEPVMQTKRESVIREVVCPIALGLAILLVLTLNLPPLIGGACCVGLFLWGIDMFGFGNPY